MTKVDENLYATITQVIDKAIDQVKVHEKKTSAENELDKAYETANKTLASFRDETRKNLEELKNAADWKTYTLAFYGETNAGKSTLIETLRIALGEEKKARDRADFKKIASELNLEVANSENLENIIQELSVKFARAEEAYKAEEKKLIQAAQQSEAQLTSMRTSLETEKANLNWWGRILLKFRKLPTEALVAQQEITHKDLLGKNRNILNIQAEEFKTIKIELSNRQAEKKALHEKYNALIPLQDGSIIGDGRSDFTLDMQSYTFKIDGINFKIIDVPGIEGSEQKVRSSIEQAVKTAHAVFYVTRKAVPPGSGSNGQKGTIDKIKDQLGQQTEVWAIYNKSATSPEALEDGIELMSEDESGSLRLMEDALKKALPESYQSCMVMSALPAFYAYCDCLLPTNIHHKKRQKFLNSISKQDLLHRSGLMKFVNFLKFELSKNIDRKIKQSNLKKIRTCLAAGLDCLNQINKNLRHAAGVMEKQVESTNTQLDNLLESTDKRLISIFRGQLEEIESDLREKVYAFIETNVSNDDFKSYFQSKLDELKEEIGPSTENQFKSQLDEFKLSIEKIVSTHNKNLNDILKYHINDKIGHIDSNFQIDFKMKNGIDMLGLISSLGGAATLVWAAFFATNPVGWAAATILGAISLVFSFYKAMREFFSSDYKKEQQRNSTNANLEKVFNSLEKGMLEKIEEATAELSKATEELKNNLKEPLLSCSKTIDYLALTAKQIFKIQEKLA